MWNNRHNVWDICFRLELRCLFSSDSIVETFNQTPLPSAISRLFKTWQVFFSISQTLPVFQKSVNINWNNLLKYHKQHENETYCYLNWVINKFVHSHVKEILQCELSIFLFLIVIWNPRSILSLNPITHYNISTLKILSERRM